MCARHGVEAIEICLSEKGAPAKKDCEILISTKGHLFQSDITCLLMSDLLLQPMIKPRNSVVPRRFFSLEKEKSSLLVLGAC